MLLAIALPSSYLLGTVLQQTGDARASVAAGLIAEQQLEEAHAVLSAAMTAGASSVCTHAPATSPDLPCTIPVTNQVVQGFTYRTDLYFQWSTLGGTADVCSSGQIPQVVLAQVTVSWGPTLRSVTQSSIVNLPYIATNPLNGFLAVQVNDSGGDGTQGVTVTATNPNTNAAFIALTDSHGCAFLTVPNLSPGYTVSLSPPSNQPGAVYVDETNNPSPSQSNMAVAAQGISSTTFQYDQAATIDLTYPSVTGVGDGITCPNANFCLATGQNQTTTTAGTKLTNGPATSEVLETNDGNDWHNVIVAGLARLLGVSCPTSSFCEGVGTATNGTGLAFGATISGNSWTIASQTLPPGVNVSELSSVACISSSQCYAVGYGIAGSTRSGVMFAFNGTSWSTVTTAGVDMMISIACPSSTACIVDANNTATPVPAPVLYTFNIGTSTFTPASLSPNPSTLTQIACGPLTSGLCVVTGAAGGTAEAYVSPDMGATWLTVGGMPAGPSTLGTPTCTSTTACIVADNAPSTSTGQILDFTATTVGPSTTWASAAATIPAGVLSISGVACSSATSCVAAGQTSGSPPEGTLLSSSDGGTSWTTTSVPGSTTSTFLSGIGCLNSACVAAGEAPTGDLTYGTDNGGWQTIPVPNQAAGVTGLLGAGWSATVGNTNLKPNQFSEIDPAAPTPVTAASPNPTGLTPLFPWASGYSVWPGGCAAETVIPPVVPVTPGGTASATASLASVALEIIDSSGQPLPAATVSMAEANPSTSFCPTETFAMPTTSADGLSRAGFSYGAYTVSIKNPLDGKVTSTSVTVGASSVTAGATTYPDPDPVIVSVA